MDVSAKTHTFESLFGEDGLPEMLSKLGVLAERSMKKLKKQRAIAPAALGGCGGLGQLWEALAELREALGELWEGLYIQKLPINRPSGRYVMPVCECMYVCMHVCMYVYMYMCMCVCAMCVCVFVCMCVFDDSC